MSDVEPKAPVAETIALVGTGMMNVFIRRKSIPVTTGEEEEAPPIVPLTTTVVETIALVGTGVMNVFIRRNPPLSLQERRKRRPLSCPLPPLLRKPLPLLAQV